MKYDNTRYASSARISVVTTPHPAIGDHMNAQATLEPQTLDLKVLIEYDPIYSTYVATCLETGAVATGSTPEEVSTQIRNTLELDIRLADEQGGLEALFFTRAAPDVWDRWYQAKAVAKPEVVTLSLSDSAVPKRGVTSVTIATARKTA